MKYKETEKKPSILLTTNWMGRIEINSNAVKKIYSDTHFFCLFVRTKLWTIVVFHINATMSTTIAKYGFVTATMDLIGQTVFSKKKIKIKFDLCTLLSMKNSSTKHARRALISYLLNIKWNEREYQKMKKN